MKPAIEIRNLGKEYKLTASQPYMSLRDTIAGSVKKILQPGKKTIEKFWALKDINLNIQPGERVGIIGRNGAGKSTLLKIISRITPPTTGHVTINGRVGSLLEVGTGFHPELTGRENIYLNGSILGLKKAEINKQLDAIIDFSGVEKFIDTPLKHFSSGMQLRLAFSVAAHLEPEILLIDEVLAVGDLEFQKKCLGKMEEVSKTGGRTILFVSHNLNFVSGLCNKAILLNEGQLINTGTTANVLGEYINSVVKRPINKNWDINPPGNDVVRLRQVQLITQDGQLKENFSVTEPIGIQMTYEVLQDGHILWLGHNIHNQEGINIFDTHNVDSPYYTQASEKGVYKATAWIPANFLNTGNFLISTAIFNHLQKTIHLHERDVLFFTVNEVFDGNTARGMSPGDFPGVIRPILKWDTIKLK